jgi:DNA polymerase I-like protein with 3'-5' exonuclease and polymerase domains
LVTNSPELFESEKYRTITARESLELLSPLEILGVDTETLGFDVYTKPLLSLQMGNEDIQVLVDCKTVDILIYKEILESKLLVLHNAKFDLKFLYHKRIVPSQIYDTYLGEKLLYLGYPPGMHGLGLKDCAKKYCNHDMDKTVRGNIIWEGLTERVIEYACDDVKYLLQIRQAQMEELAKNDLLVAADVENQFVKCLAYIEYCGVKLDVEKWKKKMQKDQQKLQESLQELNDWVVHYCLQCPEKQLSYKDTLYIDTYPGITVGELEKERRKLPRGARRAKDYDYTSSDGVFHEAYEATVQKTYIYQDLQGDLFSGFSGPKCNINWNSAKQVIPLFEELGFNLNTFDKELGKMKKSIDANIIEPQVHVSDIAPIYLKYKAAMKTTSTYGQNFIDAINPVSGRIHTNFNQLMDTGRLSCGGKDKENKTSYLNLQNLPADEETRAAFVSEKGNLWASADYSGQESVIITNVSKDPNLISFFNDALGDLHSYVAKLTFHEELKDIPLEEVKAKAKHYRQIAKKVEFAANYGGDGNTISANVGVSKAEGELIYANYLKAFPGLKDYFDYCRADVMEKGYILLNPVVRNKAYIYDYDKLSSAMQKFDQVFWYEYRTLKNRGERIYPTTPMDRNYMWDEFTMYDKPIHEIAEMYNVNDYTVYTAVVKHFFKRKSASEKQSINYRIQGTGALCFKLASIKFFNYLVKHDLLFKVKYCIPVHDEINIEFPEELKDTIPDILIQCMKAAGDVFCKIVKLDATIEVSDHWIH